jgi:hypothetical protein
MIRTNGRVFILFPQELWTSFGKTGRPVTSGGLAWPPHTGATLEAGQSMILDLEPRVETGVKVSERSGAISYINFRVKTIVSQDRLGTNA